MVTLVIRRRILERASRVEMITFDQLCELRLSAARGRITLIAVGRQARRWSMPILETDAARIQQALDRIDHLVVAPGSGARLQPCAARRLSCS
jgi:hypothetical protein